MAECNIEDSLLFDEFSSDEESGLDKDLGKCEIKEMELDSNKTQKQEIKLRDAKCGGKICELGEIGQFALYLCYVCNSYLCKNCLRDHDKTHAFVKVESNEKERKRMAYLMVERMRSERMREFNLNIEDAKLYARVNVKHVLDRNVCDISGLCGLQNRMWVVLDHNNHCMKIFNSVTNMLLRYVRFGSKPWDATEIKRKITNPDSAYESKAVVSGAARDEPEKQSLLAVTFPGIKQVWFIDVNDNPASKTMAIHLKKYCYFIDFSAEQIFTLCNENVGFGYPYSVDILSVDGDKLKVIPLDVHPMYIPDLAVFNDKIYLTDPYNHKVLCINLEDGKTCSQLNIEKGSRPRGISVDHRNNVFVCGSHTSVLYKLSPDLHRLGIEHLQKPNNICFTDDKLFVSHHRFLQSFVTVVQLT